MLIKKWEMLPYMYSTVFTPLEGKSLWLALPCLPCVEIFINDLTKSNLPNKLLTFHKINATTFSFLHWPTLKSTILIENWQWIYPLAYTEKLTIDPFTVRTIDNWCNHCSENCRLMRSLYGQLTIDAFIVRSIDDLCVDVLNICSLT